MQQGFRNAVEPFLTVGKIRVLYQALETADDFAMTFMRIKSDHQVVISGSIMGVDVHRALETGHCLASTTEFSEYRAQTIEQDSRVRQQFNASQKQACG